MASSVSRSNNSWADVATQGHYIAQLKRIQEQQVASEQVEADVTESCDTIVKPYTTQAGSQGHFVTLRKLKGGKNTTVKNSEGKVKDTTQVKPTKSQVDTSRVSESQSRSHHSAKRSTPHDIIESRSGESRSRSSPEEFITSIHDSDYMCQSTIADMLKHVQDSRNNNKSSLLSNHDNNNKPEIDLDEEFPALVSNHSNAKNDVTNSDGIVLGNPSQYKKKLPRSVEQTTSCPGTPKKILKAPDGSLYFGVPSTTCDTDLHRDDMIDSGDEAEGRSSPRQQPITSAQSLGAFDYGKPPWELGPEVSVGGAARDSVPGRHNNVPQRDDSELGDQNMSETENEEVVLIDDQKEEEETDKEENSCPPVFGIVTSLIEATTCPFDVKVLGEDWLTADLQGWGVRNQRTETSSGGEKKQEPQRREDVKKTDESFKDSGTNIDIRGEMVKEMSNSASQDSKKDLNEKDNELQTEVDKVQENREVEDRPTADHAVTTVKHHSDNEQERIQEHPITSEQGEADVTHRKFSPRRRGKRTGTIGSTDDSNRSSPPSGDEEMTSSTSPDSDSSEAPEKEDDINTVVALEPEVKGNELNVVGGEDVEEDDLGGGACGGAEVGGSWGSRCPSPLPPTSPDDPDFVLAWNPPDLQDLIPNWGYETSESNNNLTWNSSVPVSESRKWNSSAPSSESRRWNSSAPSSESWRDSPRCNSIPDLQFEKNNTLPGSLQNNIEFDNTKQDVKQNTPHASAKVVAIPDGNPADASQAPNRDEVTENNDEAPKENDDVTNKQTVMGTASVVPALSDGKEGSAPHGQEQKVCDKAVDDISEENRNPDTDTKSSNEGTSVITTTSRVSSRDPSLEGREVRQILGTPSSSAHAQPHNNRKQDHSSSGNSRETTPTKSRKVSPVKFVKTMQQLSVENTTHSNAPINKSNSSPKHQRYRKRRQKPRKPEVTQLEPEVQDIRPPSCSSSVTMTTSDLISLPLADLMNLHLQRKETPIEHIVKAKNDNNMRDNTENTLDTQITMVKTSPVTTATTGTGNRSAGTNQEPGPQPGLKPIQAETFKKGTISKKSYPAFQNQDKNPVAHRHRTIREASPGSDSRGNSSAPGSEQREASPDRMDAYSSWNPMDWDPFSHTADDVDQVAPLVFGAGAASGGSPGGDGHSDTDSGHWTAAHEGPSSRRSTPRSTPYSLTQDSPTTSHAPHHHSPQEVKTSAQTPVSQASCLPTLDHPNRQTSSPPGSGPRVQAHQPPQDPYRLTHARSMEDLPQHAPHPHLMNQRRSMEDMFNPNPSQQQLTSGGDLRDSTVNRATPNPIERNNPTNTNPIQNNINRMNPVQPHHQPHSQQQNTPWFHMHPWQYMYMMQMQQMQQQMHRWQQPNLQPGFQPPRSHVSNHFRFGAPMGIQQMLQTGPHSRSNPLGPNTSALQQNTGCSSANSFPGMFYSSTGSDASASERPASGAGFEENNSGRNSSASGSECGRNGSVHGSESGRNSSAPGLESRRKSSLPGYESRRNSSVRDSESGRNSSGPGSVFRSNTYALGSARAQETVYAHASGVRPKTAARDVTIERSRLDDIDDSDRDDFKDSNDVINDVIHDVINPVSREGRTQIRELKIPAKKPEKGRDYSSSSEEESLVKKERDVAPQLKQKKHENKKTPAELVKNVTNKRKKKSTLPSKPLNQQQQQQAQPPVKFRKVRKWFRRNKLLLVTIFQILFIIGVSIVLYQVLDGIKSGKLL